MSQIDVVVEAIKVASRQFPLTTETLKSMRDQIRTKTDILLTYAAQTSSPDNCTVLQKTIGILLALPSTTAGVAILLSLQAENLPDAFINIFLLQSQSFFAIAANCKPQLIFAHKEAVIVAQKLTHLSQRAHQPKAVCRILMQAALSSAPQVSCMTPMHALFLQTCISAKMYTLGADFLRKNEILGIDPNNTGLSALDYLTFFYYGGMCFVGVKDYITALDYLTQAIVLPAQAVSAVVVASLKMARLVSLIEHGIAYEVPKYASNCVLRYSRQDMPVYDSIVKQFVANNATALSAAVEGEHDILNQDHNLGLARQVRSALVRHNVRKLTSTYITLSLADIAATAGLTDVDAAEVLLRTMIASGDIVAKINQQTGMVRFGEDDVEHGTKASQQNGQGSGSGSASASAGASSSSGSGSGSGMHGYGSMGVDDDGSSRRQQQHHREAASEMLLHTLEGHITESITMCDRIRTLQQQVLTSSEYISRSNQSSYSRVLGGGSGAGMKGGYGGMRGWGEGDAYL